MDVVERIRRAIEAGADIEPVVLHELHDGQYIIRDGRHRLQAFELAGIGLVPALVKQ
jgi:ParB-like chromosome segregation protein Spo0J